MFDLLFFLVSMKFGISLAYSIETVNSPISVIGEGPHWDVGSRSLYYVDIYGTNSTVLRYDYDEDITYSAIIVNMLDTPINVSVVSFIIPLDDAEDEFAVGMGHRIGIIRWNGRDAQAELVRIALVVEQEARYRNNRWNDAKADPLGRFFGGTMRLESAGDLYNSADGSLYRYARDEPLVKLKSDVGVSNGLTWNLSEAAFYWIDTVAFDVKVFDYEVETGDIYNERRLISFRSANGDRPNYDPDGMTIDDQGYLYVATFGGSWILRIDPSTGKIVQHIKLPAKQITSAAFGGPNLDILYVTSAAQERTEKQPWPAGSLFAVHGLGVRGLPMQNVRL